MGEIWNHLIKIDADGSYAGKLTLSLKKKIRLTFKKLKRTEVHKSKILPLRWIVEGILCMVRNL